MSFDEQRAPCAPQSPLTKNTVRQAVHRFRTANPRIFGSVRHGDQDGRGLDLLVDALPEATLFDLGIASGAGIFTGYSH